MWVLFLPHFPYLYNKTSVNLNLLGLYHVRWHCWCKNWGNIYRHN
ncbi:hypothetical protein [Okeania sp. SIO3I5]|nr:hypothetical protein [Okeania sp. SIO3I5]